MRLSDLPIVSLQTENNCLLFDYLQSGHQLGQRLIQFFYVQDATEGQFQQSSLNR